MYSIESPDACVEHFNKVYDETFCEIKKFIAVKCSDTWQLSDIIQETYLEYYKLISKKGTDSIQSDISLLYKIAKRKVFRYYSQKQRLAAIVPLFRENENGEEYCTADAECETSPDNEIITEMEAGRIWALINTYPPDVRKIIYLYFCEGMSHSQIAEALGCGLSNVKNKLYRTLSEIRERRTEMDENKLKKICENHMPDKEQIRKNILSSVKTEENTRKHYNLKPVLAACAAAFLIVVGLGGYAFTAEAAEYRQAVEFFNEYSLSTDGYTRSEIKAVYRDITEKTYSYEKTIEILNNISVEMYQTELGTADKDKLEALWNNRNYLMFGNTEKKDGIHYGVDYNDDISTIIKYDGEKELWRYTVPFDMYVFADDNILVCDDGLIVYGQKNIAGGSSGYAVAFMLSNSRKLLWEHADGKINQEFDTASRHGDEITLLGISYSPAVSGKFESVFTVLDTSGKVKIRKIFENDELTRYDAVVRIGDSYLVKRRVRSQDYSFEPELVSMSLSGELTEKFSYSEGGVTYKIQDIIHYGGKVYLSALLPNVTDAEFHKTFISLMNEYIPEWEKDQNVKMSDDYNKRLNDLFITQYSAALLVCDENAVITKAYSAENARAGALTVTDDGKLSWQVIRADEAKNVPPVFSSRSVDIAATEFAFIFGEDGCLTEKREVGAYALMY